MKCTKCGSLENQVNNTRTRLSTRGHNIDSKASSIPFTWRSRTCLFCGHKYRPYRKLQGLCIREPTTAQTQHKTS